MGNRWVLAVVGVLLGSVHTAAAQSHTSATRLRIVKPLKLDLPSVPAPIRHPVVHNSGRMNLNREFRWKRKNWIFESLKRLDVTAGDPLFGVRIALDTAKRQAVIKLRSRALARMGLGLKTDVTIRGNRALIDAAFALKIADQRYNLELPQVELVPRNYRGTQYIEYRLPLLRGDF